MATTSRTYIERREAMARLGYRSVGCWYDDIRNGLIAGVERRGRSLFYIAEELEYVGPKLAVPTVRQRFEAERVRRLAAAVPRGGWTNPFLRMSARAAG